MAKPPSFEKQEASFAQLFAARPSVPPSSSPLPTPSAVFVLVLPFTFFNPSFVPPLAPASTALSI
jgi:hypothetical protein